MADNQAAFIKELTDKLENGIRELYDSEKYKAYLTAMAKFPSYSARNVMLIKMQRPEATMVNSYKRWKEDFNRQVNKGEKAIRIYAPIVSTIKEQREKTDPETGAPLLDKDGQIVTEEVELRSMPRFKLVPVFAAEQTSGDPLPVLAENLVGDVEHYGAFLDALKEVSPLPIVFEPLAENNDGYCRYGEKIGIREGMSEIQTVSAIVHELTHMRLHDPTNTDNPKLSKKVKEQEAESVSYVVCAKYNLDTSANSFGYLSGYADRDLKELQGSLDTIRKESNDMITAINEKYLAICAERGINLIEESEPPAHEKQPGVEDWSEPAAENAPDNPGAPSDDVDAHLPEAEIPSNGAPLRYSQLQQKGFELAKSCERLPLQEQLNIIAQTFGCETASVETHPCTGKWRGTSDIFIVLDNGASLGIGNYRTPEAKKAAIIKMCVNKTLVRYHPEIVAEAKALATAALTARQAEDNAIAAQMGLKPYTFLGVELNDGANPRSSDYLGWYYAALAVEGKPFGFVESGLNHDIARGVLSEHPDRRDYFVAGSLRDNEVDFVFNNVGHSSFNGSHQVHLSDDAREHAEAKLGNLSHDPLSPDQSINIYDMVDYGYADDAMLPLTRERALELFDAEHTIYMLCDDETEAMVFDRDEIITFSEMNQGIFGIAKGEWESSSEYKSLVAQNDEPARESDLLHGDGNMYGIYQLKGGDETRDLRFEPLDRLQSHGFEVDKNNYDLVYSAALDIRDTQSNLHKIFNMLNSDTRPDDFTGHSLSVSDIIVLQWRGEISSHYVDSFGFSELPDFTGHERTQEQEISPETTEMDKIHAQVDRDESVSLMDVVKAQKADRQAVPDKKPSILGQLDGYKAMIADQATQKTNRTNELEV